MGVMNNGMSILVSGIDYHQVIKGLVLLGPAASTSTPSAMIIRYPDDLAPAADRSRSPMRSPPRSTGKARGSRRGRH